MQEHEKHGRRAAAISRTTCSNAVEYEPALTVARGDNTVELIRIPAGEIINGDFTVEVVPAVSAKAVPGLDGSGANQDFALYVYNAN